MEPEHFLYRTEGPIAILTINRPELRNAFSHEMLSQWQQALKRVKQDKEVRAAILTGNGNTFCSGADLRELAEGKLRSWDMKKFLWEQVHRIVFLMEDMDTPVIAAVNGAATGAGLDMALMCDLRICSDTAIMGETYILMGIVAGDGGAYFLPKIVGFPKAMELLLTGEMIDAKEAFRIGMVNKVVAKDRLMEEAMGLAGRLAEKPPLAVKMMKRAVYQAANQSLRSHLDFISSQVALLSETEDHKEAVTAFLEKRKPSFVGK